MNPTRFAEPLLTIATNSRHYSRFLICRKVAAAQTTTLEGAINIFLNDKPYERVLLDVVFDHERDEAYLFYTEKQEVF